MWKPYECKIRLYHVRFGTVFELERTIVKSNSVLLGCKDNIEPATDTLNNRTFLLGVFLSSIKSVGSRSRNRHFRAHILSQ